MTQHTPSTHIVAIASAGPVVLQGVPTLDYEALLAIVDAEDSNRFPGQRLQFKKQWVFGRDAAPVEADVLPALRLVVNMPHTVMGWRHYRDDQLTYGPIAYPCAGQQLPTRQTLGDTDEMSWPLYKDKPSDPWKKYLVVPFRTDGGSEVHHLMLSTWSAMKEYRGLLRKFATEGRTRPGQLPVVRISSRLEQHYDDPDVTYFVPTFEIVDWQAATEVDIPASVAQVSQVAQEPQPVPQIPAAPAPTVHHRTEDAAKLAEDAKALSDIVAGVPLAPSGVNTAPPPAQSASLAPSGLTAASKPASSLTPGGSTPAGLFGSGKRQAAAGSRLR